MSSPTSQFKSINSLVLSLLYGPNLTSLHDYWKNHSFDCTDLCQQSNVSAFEYAIWVGHNFSSKEQASYNFMTVLTICSDCGAPQIKSVTVSIVSPSIFHEEMGQDAMILIFGMLSFKPAFSLSSFISSRGCLVPLHFLL